jgi:hypothetical protein
MNKPAGIETFFVEVSGVPLLNTTSAVPRL